jgi:hypothetical protein
MPTKIITGAARIVWGHPLTAKPKIDQNTNQPVRDPATGQPIMQWAFGIAIPKHEFGPVWQAMAAEAATLFPQNPPQNFAWKYKDGDGVDDKGQPFSAREGYAGHYVLNISTESFGPRCVRNVNGAYADFTDIKTGDYVRVGLTIKAHNGKPGTRSVPGLYINPDMLEFLGYGTPIFNGPDAMALFGGQAVALPAGASAVPIVPQGSMPMPGGTPGAPAPFPAPGAPAHAPGAVYPSAPHAGFPGSPGTPPMTVSPTNPPPAYAPAPPPAHDFVHNAAQQPMPGQQRQPNYPPMPGQPPR